MNERIEKVCLMLKLIAEDFIDIKKIDFVLPLYQELVTHLVHFENMMK